MKLTNVFAALAALAGCVDNAPDSTDQTSSEIVATSSPPVSESFTGWMPDLKVSGDPGAAPVQGYLADADLSDTNRYSVHGGSFTDYRDLAPPPVLTGQTTITVGSGTAGDWVRKLTGQPHTVTANFDDVLEQAMGAAVNRKLGQLDTGIVDTVFDLIDFLGGDVDDPTVASRFVGYPAEHARWLTSIFTRSATFMRRYTFESPLVMANQRERGARLYCAAREAQRKQAQYADSRTLGRQVGFNLAMFGYPIDFLIVEPSATIDGPLPYLGGPPGCPAEGANCPQPPTDGAQAFMVPFLFGVKIQLMSLLPPLPEVRYPVVMLSGDSEILSNATHPGYGYRSSQTDSFQTSTHADAVLSTEGTSTASFRTPLFYIGPVEVDLKVGMGVAIGQLYADDAMQCHPAEPDRKPDLPGNAVAANDRLLLNVPGARGGGHTSYLDGPWLLSPFDASTTGQTQVSIYDNGAPSRFTTLVPYDPMFLRTFESDDRHLKHATSIGLCGGVVGFVPTITVPGLNIEAGVGGALSGKVTVQHDLRDAEIAADTASAAGPTAQPVSVVTIAPSVRASADFELAIHLKVTVWIPWPIDENISIYDDDLVSTGNVNLANYDSGPWSEPSRMRIGTGSANSWSADPMMDPDVTSKVPGVSPVFPAFGQNQTVATCLGDTRQNPPTPPACRPDPTTVPHTPPRIEICMYMGGPGNADTGAPGGLPLGICSNTASYVATLGLDAVQTHCMQRAYDYLCQPVSAVQPWNGRNVVARVLNQSDTALLNDMRDIERECITAFVPAGTPNYNQAAQAWARANLFQFSVCNTNAGLIDRTNWVKPGLNPNQAPPVTPGSCQ